MTIDGGNVTVNDYDKETYQVHEYEPINEGIIVCKHEIHFISFLSCSMKEISNT